MRSPRWKNPDIELPKNGIDIPVRLKTNLGIIDAFWHTSPSDVNGGAFSNWSTDGQVIPDRTIWWIAFGETIYQTAHFVDIEIYFWCYRVAK